MGVLLWIVAVLAAVIWVITAVDIFRRRYPGWTTFGWIVLILVLPFVGSLIYWVMRKPSADEIERQRLAEADVRHDAATRSIDSSRTQL
ncbi:MAG TPA: PLD nuclease N-terminal domain-containing protein [Solirubrobacteraceae bacterium]|jgi:Phospholipase_D-nuclease N-terminal|nr:PLD nuclease N-terminal domain-containing protein [Solirubrobacteraceae bacterium]